MEWSNQSKYNSFNSYKGLSYYEHYKRIVGWLEEKNELPPPVECSLDPIMKCNNNCYYCNSQTYLHKKPAPPLNWGEMYSIIEFLVLWGVKGLCFGGGGESTLNQEVANMIGLANTKGLQTALVTNGSMLYDGYLREALMGSRWVGVSLDAGETETYKRIRGVDKFCEVIYGIQHLVALKVERQSKVDIAIKVLVLPENYTKLYDICELAKSLGVDDFHIRPVDLERKDFKTLQKLNLDLTTIHDQFARCHELETDKFHVYTVMHKYDENFHVKHDFNGCLASPLVIQICTDGQCYVCVDHRMEERFRLGSMVDIKSWWGGRKHRELVKSIDPHRECSRCTWSEYNKQIEEVVINDRMCVAFP